MQASRIAIFVFSLSLLSGRIPAQINVDMFHMPSILKKSKKSFAPSRLTSLEQSPRVPSDAPVDENLYLLGPGDVLNVYLGGAEEVTVSPEGVVLLPQVPPVKVSGKSLAESKLLIKKALARQYDTSKVHVSLAGLNVFKVQVLGEISSPGSRPMNSFTRLSEAVSLAGGFTRYSNRSRLTVIRSSGDSAMINLSEFYRSYRDADNPFVNIGEKIVVSGVDFSRPFCSIKNGDEILYHQIEDDATLKEIFSQVNNYGLSAPPTKCRISGAGGRRRLLDAREVLSYRPAAGDTIEFVREVDHVFVGGAVSKPHVYEYVPNFQAADYLYLAGVLPQSARHRRFSVIREGDVLDPEEVAKTGMKPGDKLYLDRNRMENVKEYLGIIAPLAGIIISSATLYYTVNANSSK